MAFIPIERTSCLDSAINIDRLSGAMFTQENEAHQFVITCTQNNAQLTLTGTITAKVVLANGNTVELVGTIDGGKAVVTLTQPCYNTAGRIQISIFNTVGSTKLCIYAAIAYVQTAEHGDLIDGSQIIDSVEDLIADIQAAVATIPPDYSTLSNQVADLKSAFDNSQTSLGVITGAIPVVMYPGYWTTPAVGTASEFKTSDVWMSARFPVTDGQKIRVNCNGRTGTQRLYAYLDSDGNVVYQSSTNLTGERELTVPSGINAVEMVVNNSLASNPTGYYIYTGQSFVADAKGVIYKDEDFEQGAITDQGADGTSTVYCRIGDFIPVETLYSFYKPIGMTCLVNAYDSGKAFIKRVSYSSKSEINYDREMLLNNIAATGAAFLRFAVKRYIDGAEVNSTPQDIIDSDFSLKLYGASDAIYSRIKIVEGYEAPITEAQEEIDSLKESLSYRLTDFVQGSITTSGNDGTSNVYCRTDYIDIDKVFQIVKPESMTMIIGRYDSSQTFIARASISGDISVDYNAETVTANYGGGNTKYLRFAVKRSVDGTEVDSTPQDIVNSNLDINLLNDLNTVNQQIIGLQEQIDAIGTETIPSYYTESGYLQDRLDKITTIQKNISANNDAFWLMSDYHYSHNAGNSQMLLKYLSKQTGINRLHFGGDAGGSEGTTDSARLHALQHSANVWGELSSCVDEMYGVLGNHEWISSSVYGLNTMFAAYLNRYKTHLTMDAGSCSYYVDNAVNKIRYYFIQDMAAAYPVAIGWFGEQLKAVPEGYSVAVLMHHGYIPASVTAEEYGFDVSYNYTSIRGVSALLKAWRDHESVTISSTTYDFTSGTTNRSVICVFCAHMHHSTLYAGGTESGVEGITVFRASEDALNENNIGINGHPWFWAYNEATQAYDIKTERTAGTIYEQCFYCVQLDLENKHMYITAIGGDRDWDCTYEILS